MPHNNGVGAEEEGTDESVRSLPDEITFVSERPDSLLARLTDRVAIGLFLLLFAVGALQVAVRFVLSPYLGFNVAWTGEAARFILIYMTMVGSIAAARDRDHIQIEVVSKRVPRQVRRVFEFVIHACALAFLVFATYGAYLATLSSVGVPPGAVPYITMEYVSVALVIGFVGMTAYELRWLIVDLGLTSDRGGGLDE